MKTITLADNAAYDLLDMAFEYIAKHPRNCECGWCRAYNEVDRQLREEVAIEQSNDLAKAIGRARDAQKGA